MLGCIQEEDAAGRGESNEAIEDVGRAATELPGYMSGIGMRRGALRAEPTRSWAPGETSFQRFVDQTADNTIDRGAGLELAAVQDDERQVEASTGS
jgi:hypothetical protein